MVWYKRTVIIVPMAAVALAVAIAVPVAVVTSKRGNSTVAASQADNNDRGIGFAPDPLDPMDKIGPDALFTVSDYPSMTPSDFPSWKPSDLPSLRPSDFPSMAPSDAPSIVPSDAPSNSPSDVPSDSPSDTPSDMPLVAYVASDYPSLVPVVFAAPDARALEQKTKQRRKAMSLLRERAAA
jgi:hypothetical protein